MQSFKYIFILGDLMLTCFGKLSRNMSFGVKLAEGIPIEDIIK